MLTSKFTRIKHVVTVARDVAHVIHKTNVELAKVLVEEFAPSRNKEEAETDDVQDEIEDDLTDAQKLAAATQATNDSITEFWKSYMNVKPPVMKTEI